MLRCATRVKSLKNLGRVSVANVLGRLANSLSLSTKTKCCEILEWAKQDVSKSRCKIRRVREWILKKVIINEFLGGIKVTQKMCKTKVRIV